MVFCKYSKVWVLVTSYHHIIIPCPAPVSVYAHCSHLSNQVLELTSSVLCTNPLCNFDEDREPKRSNHLEKFCLCLLGRPAILKYFKDTNKVLVFIIYCEFNKFFDTNKSYFAMEQYLFNISSLTRWLETHEIIIKISAETRADGARCPNPYNGARTGTAPPPSTPLPSRHGFCPFCLHCTHRRSPQVPRRRSRQPTPYRHSSSVDSPMFPSRSPVPPPTSTFEQFPVFSSKFTIATADLFWWTIPCNIFSTILPNTKHEWNSGFSCYLFDSLVFPVRKRRNSSDRSHKDPIAIASRTILPLQDECQGRL